MDLDITLTYQGKVVIVPVDPTEGAEETEYKVDHSLAISSNPARVGIIDTNKVYGMQYEQHVGHTPNLNVSMIMRRVIEERMFRPPLIKYI